MSESYKYTITLMMAPDYAVNFDQEYFMFQMFKEAPNARLHVNEKGASISSDYDWRDPEDDLREFSRRYPEVLIVIDLVGNYDGEFYSRYYVQGGLTAKVEPEIVVTWPKFDPGMLA